MKKLIVVAIGGNSLIKNNTDTQHDQYLVICETAANIADLIEQGYDVLVSHGNGPQVGKLLLSSEISAKKLKTQATSLVLCGASTQGSIGYQIQQAMDNEFERRNIKQIINTKINKEETIKTAVTLITQITVDEKDPSFNKPEKPIGLFYSKEEIIEIKQQHPDWTLMKEGKRGYRRVVSSPKPLKVIEIEAIKNLLNAGFLVIAGGGGGIPVQKVAKNQYKGIDAVIDKDFATSLLASQLDASLLIISTGVEKVFLNFAKPNERGLNNVTYKEMTQYIKEGHFAPGSMLPKIKAALNFIKNGGKKVIITNPTHLKDAINGKTGTHIQP